MRLRICILFTTVLAWGPPAGAELVDTSATVTTTITEFRAAASQSPEELRKDEITNGFPDPTSTLPLQLAARLTTQDEEAAGVAAAQVAEPIIAPDTNPEELALSISLNSLSSEIFYTGAATLEELRQIRLSRAEVGAGLLEQTTRLRSRLFLDGILAVFATADSPDLTGVELTLAIMITLERDGAEPTELYSGGLTITGGPDRELTVTTAGQFPADALLDADLSDLDEELPVFRVLVLPETATNYDYEVPFDETVTLRATVEATAANRPTGVGVAIALGTPLDSLLDVITLTRDPASAKHMVRAIQEERATPTGTPLGPDASLTAPPIALCGLFGLETALLPLMLFAFSHGRRIASSPSSLRRFVASLPLRAFVPPCLRAFVPSSKS